MERNVEDVYEPLSRYRDEFRARHAALTRAKFEELSRQSQVDIRLNRRLSAEVGRLEAQAGFARGRLWLLGFLILLFFGAAGVCGLVLDRDAGPADNGVRAGLVAGLVAGVFAGIAAVVAFSRQFGRLNELKKRRIETQRRAGKLLEPLFRLFRWELPVKLIEASVPRLAFDPYFTAKRLQDLHELCGWSDAFNDGKSVLGSLSGVINGNPFVFADCLVAGWGTQTYRGSLEISWLEEEEDDEGHTHLVRRYETLHASVEKPCPVYTRDKLLVYGNDAAPNLSFTRRPSGLAGKKSGFWKSLQKRRARKRLEAFSRNLDDDSDYTIMANREFETLFETTDRDNAVEYRLLFSALAQLQMLELVNDETDSFGDDFTFLKRRKINVIRSPRLDEADIDTDPAQFRHWSYDRLREKFQKFNEAFFHDVYFSLAPLLAIPLYQQTRPHAEIWKGVAPESPSSFWEHEALANYHGEARFRHPDCVTHSLLKTKVVSRDEGATRVAVTAHGYRTEDRVDYVKVWGGDGNCHDVPVHWDEYLPVSRTREMTITERATPAETFQSAFRKASATAFRRSISSYLR